MSNRVRVQLQEGHTDIDSEIPTGISADATIAALSKLVARNRKLKSDSKWERGLTSAIRKAIDWVKRTKLAGGYMPLRGSGNVHRDRFTYDRKEYRIDIECHGAKDADWFGK
jgi:hypothetical protein